MTSLEEINSDTICLAIEKQRELLRNTSEKDEIQYNKALDALNGLLILKDKITVGGGR